MGYRPHPQNPRPSTTLHRVEPYIGSLVPTQPDIYDNQGYSNTNEEWEPYRKRRQPQNGVREHYADQHGYQNTPPIWAPIPSARKVDPAHFIASIATTQRVLHPAQATHTPRCPPDQPHP